MAVLGILEQERQHLNDQVDITVELGTLIEANDILVNKYRSSVVQEG